MRIARMWTPSRLIKTFCPPGLRPGYRAEKRVGVRSGTRHAGSRAYRGAGGYEPGVNGRVCVTAYRKDEFGIYVFDDAAACAAYRDRHLTGLTPAEATVEIVS